MTQLCELRTRRLTWSRIVQSSHWSGHRWGDRRKRNASALSCTKLNALFHARLYLSCLLTTAIDQTMLPLSWLVDWSTDLFIDRLIRVLSMKFHQNGFVLFMKLNQSCSPHSKRLVIVIKRSEIRHVQNELLSNRVFKPRFTINGEAVNRCRSLPTKRSSPSLPTAFKVQWTKSQNWTRKKRTIC